MPKRIFFNLYTSAFRLYEWLRVVIFYYTRSLSFVKIDLLLASQYLLKSPHRISKAFLASRGESNVYQFGETPLTTLDHIVRTCGILSHDTVYEVGCGSGRTCFWLRHFVRCKVVGIDYLSTFIHKANSTKKKAHLRNIDFLNADMLTVDYTPATVVYLYGTCLEDDLISQLASCITRPGTRIITTSYPLSDYSASFKTLNSFSARFPWGTAHIFLNIRL